MLLLCWRVTKIAYPRNRLQQKLPRRPTFRRGASPLSMLMTTKIRYPADGDDTSQDVNVDISGIRSQVGDNFTTQPPGATPTQLPHNTHNDIPRIYRVWKSDSVNPTQFRGTDAGDVTIGKCEGREGKFNVVHATTPTHKFHFTTHIPRKSFALSRIGSAL